MKSISFNDFLDQKKLPSHILIGLISWIITLLFPGNSITFFLMIFLQIELFILMGNRIFKEIQPDKFKKKFTSKIISRLILYIILCFSIALLITILYNLHLYGLNLQVVFTFFSNEFRGWFLGTIGGLFFGAAIFLYLQWQDALIREQKLREENLIFQNETLKSQLNPHFLFNSLNTLSALFHSQPEIAEEYINRLSSIYRYILENSTLDMIPLEDELAFIRNYFFLHKIRNDDKIQLEIMVDSHQNHKILPVSIQGLMENAIKHNKATRESNLKITIFLEGEYIVVQNNLQKMGTQTKSTGIGLKNLAERVKLISGRNLIVEESHADFIVKIPLLS